MGLLENKRPELLGHGGTVPTLPGIAESDRFGGNAPLGSTGGLGPKRNDNERNGE